MDQNRKSRKNTISRREFLVGSGAIIAAIALNACTTKQNNFTNVTTGTATSTSDTTATPTIKRGGTLKVIFNSGPQSALGYPPEVGVATAQMDPCLETLLRADNKGNIYPWLAESYVVADDFKSVNFALRKGVKFHDGSDFNATAAKWNIENMISAKKTPNLTSVDAVDDYTIRVNFVKWSSSAVSSFADNSTQIWMVSKDSFDKNGLDYVKQHPVGTGAFKYLSLVRDSNMKFEKNPNYWQKDMPYLDAIEELFISDQSTQNLAMQSGEADMIPAPLVKTLSTLEKMGLIIKYYARDTVALVPDSANADSPWYKKEVREAAEYAIDKETIAKAFGFGYYQAPYQLAGHGSSNYNPDFIFTRKYDLEKAKQLLDQAGYTANPRFKTTISVAPFGVDRDVATAVQGELAKINIQAELDFPDMGRWVTNFSYKGTWHNGCTFVVTPSDANYLTGLPFIINNTGQGWLRTPELMAAYNAYTNTKVSDLNLAHAVTDQLSKDAIFIPVIESGAGWVYRPSVMNAGPGDRLMTNNLKYEQAWLNK